MIPPTLLDEEQLGKATFDLLTSSVASRYVRMAQAAAHDFGLVQRFRSEPELARQTLVRVAALWVEALGQRCHSIEEVEVAVLVAALVEAEIPGLGPMLREMDETHAASVIWVSALAQRLLRAMSNEQRQQLERRYDDRYGDVMSTWKRARLCYQLAHCLQREDPASTGCPSPALSPSVPPSCG